MSNAANTALAAIATATADLIRPDDPALAKLDEIASQASLIDSGTGMTFTSLIRTANAVAVLKAALTPEIMAHITPLQGTKLGFKTDRDAKGDRYPDGVVKDCLIEAVLRGVPAVGNCFNIIGGNFYLTKEGVIYKLNHTRGLRYDIDPGLPVVLSEPRYEKAPDGTRRGVPGEANVPVDIKWSLDGGEEQRRELCYKIKVNNGMGSDALVGKAVCRAAKWLLAAVTGLDSPVTEGSDDAPAPAAAPAQAAPAPVSADTPTPKALPQTTQADRLKAAAAAQKP